MGMNDRVIAVRRRGGELHRIRHGAYTTGESWRLLDEAGQHVLAVRAVLAQGRTGLIVSHSSAVPLHGGPLWGLPMQSVNVTRRDSRTGRRAAGVRQHRGLIFAGDVVEVRGLPVMSPTRTALEVTTQASAEASLAVVNHFLHGGATTVEALLARYELGMDRWPSTLKTGLVLRRAQPLCESVGESRFWHLCHARNLPLPAPQFVVRDDRGAVVARLDFAWPELGVFAEFDGLTKYRQPFTSDQSAANVVVQEKLREDHVRELTGWTCLRVTWADLADPRALEARLRRAFTSAKTTAVA